MVLRKTILNNLVSFGTDFDSSILDKNSIIRLRSIPILSRVFILTVLITVTALSKGFAQSDSIQFTPGADTTLLYPDSVNFYPDSARQKDSLVSSSASKIDTTLSEDAITSRVDYEAADSMKIDMLTEKVYLYGAAQVNYEDIQYCFRRWQT